MDRVSLDLSGHVVLIVEDQPVPAFNLQIALEEAGADAIVARGPLEAIARLSEFVFSAAILDADQRKLARDLEQRGLAIVFKTAARNELLARLAASVHRSSKSRLIRSNP